MMPMRGIKNNASKPGSLHNANSCMSKTRLLPI